MKPALLIRDLRKSFGRPAVAGLTLKVQSGELYALLGPNGAGKTTTLRMVAGLLKPDAGTIQVFGIDAVARPLEAKRVVAWLPDDPMIYGKLSPLEYLEFVAGLWSVPAAEARDRAVDLLHRLDLWDHRHDHCENFSRGMNQKVGLAGALVHDPRLLILDEPLTGLDAAIARQVKDILAERIAAGATVILTTHILEVAERLSDRIGIIDRGRLIAEGTAAELAREAGGSASLEQTFLHLTREARDAA
jgi:ABC-2 type transport system ATP-binding protein